jgi:integrase
MLSVNNTPLYTVSKLLGHTNARTTEDSYGHLSTENLDEAMLKEYTNYSLNLMKRICR